MICLSCNRRKKKDILGIIKDIFLEFFVIILDICRK